MRWSTIGNICTIPFDNISNLFPSEVLRIICTMNHWIALHHLVFIPFRYYSLFCVMLFCWISVDTHDKSMKHSFALCNKNRLVRWPTRCDVTWYDMRDKTIKSQRLIMSFKVSRLIFDKSEKQTHNKHNQCMLHHDNHMVPINGII